MTDVHYWVWPLQDEDSERELVRYLLPEERARAARYHMASDRQAFLIARGGLRSLLAGFVRVEPTALQFAKSCTGKPYLTGVRMPEFNLSHTRTHAVCAVSTAPVGVDIESVGLLQDISAMLEQVATIEERREVEALSKSERLDAFYRLWVRKEALLKASGEGLLADPKRHPVGTADWSGTDWHDLGAAGKSGRRWMARQISAPMGHQGALVVSAEFDELPNHHLRVLPHAWAAKHM